MMKILVPDKVNKSIKKIMIEKGHDIDYLPGLSLEKTKEIAKDYDAIMVRSYKLHGVDFGDKVKAIARAGSGVNNIPVDECTKKGVVVFNAPGANSNAVKELVICSLILASRGISNSIEWTKNLGDDLRTVEKEKSQFKGSEIMGKNLVVIGLGAIGCLIANAANCLGMNVVGFDPFITVDNALKLSRGIKHSDNLEKTLALADFITVHVPLNDKTKGFIDEKMFSGMKQGVKLLNFSRKEIVHHKALERALSSGRVTTYITDFPDEKLILHKNVITIPHLGASTFEAEENCTNMIAGQIDDFLCNGNIKNSVNFPKINLEEELHSRLAVFNKNVPAIIGSVSEILAKHNININSMVNKSQGDFAYNLLELDTKCSNIVIDEILAVTGVIRIRKIN